MELAALQCCWARQTRFEKSGFHLVMVMFVCCIFLSVLPYYFPFMWHDTHTNTQNGSRWQIKWKCIYSHFLAGQKETMQEASLKICSSQVKKEREKKRQKKTCEKTKTINLIICMSSARRKDFTWKIYRKISMFYVGMY